MSQWRIYYDDGSTYDGPVDLAPCDGVIVVAQADADVGREILHLKDFYYWERDRWFGCDLYGLWDYLRRPGWKKTLAGRNTEHRNYSAIYQRALDDDDLPPKSARHMNEAPRRA
ncbi:MAG: hypothetical protein EHM89_00200 [Acidobacteria bacterium]|nr:MAG: hypothetical protein EHM89_00200 [Acidobacteriota bacterium]